MIDSGRHPASPNICTFLLSFLGFRCVNSCRIDTIDIIAVCKYLVEIARVLCLCKLLGIDPGLCRSLLDFDRKCAGGLKLAEPSQLQTQDPKGPCRHMVYT